MTHEQTSSRPNDARCSFDDDSVHIHPVNSLSKPRRLKETTAFDVYGAWLFTSIDGAALLVANELPQFFEDSGGMLSEYIQQVRNNAESEYLECEEWIELLREVGKGDLAVSSDDYKAFVMSIDSAIDYVLRNKDDYGLDSNATWYVV